MHGLAPGAPARPPSGPEQDQGLWTADLWTRQGWGASDPGGRQPQEEAGRLLAVEGAHGEDRG